MLVNALMLPAQLKPGASVGGPVLGPDFLPDFDIGAGYGPYTSLKFGSDNPTATEFSGYVRWTKVTAGAIDGRERTNLSGFTIGHTYQVHVTAREGLNNAQLVFWDDVNTTYTTRTLTDAWVVYNSLSIVAADTTVTLALGLANTTAIGDYAELKDIWIEDIT